MCESAQTTKRLRTKSARLTQIAERRGWEVVEIYRDAGISGANGRDGTSPDGPIITCSVQRSDRIPTVRGIGTVYTPSPPHRSWMRNQEWQVTSLSATRAGS